MGSVYMYGPYSMNQGWTIPTPAVYLRPQYPDVACRDPDVEDPGTWDIRDLRAWGMRSEDGRDEVERRVRG